MVVHAVQSAMPSYMLAQELIEDMTRECYSAAEKDEFHTEYRLPYDGADSKVVKSLPYIEHYFVKQGFMFHYEYVYPIQAYVINLNWDICKVGGLA